MNATVAQPIPSIVEHSILDWVVRTGTPPGWPEAIQVCGGGFFHSPPGLLAGSPRGEPMYIDLWRGNKLIGVAAGVRHGCRFSTRLHHAYFPTLPAVRDPALREASLATLFDAMRAEDLDDVVVDSFDASWSVPSADGAEIAEQRNEYLVRLEHCNGEVPAGFAENHRRHCARGARLGWTVRAAHGAEAASLLANAQQAASERATLRGDRFRFESPPAESFDRVSAEDPWGMTVFAGWHGDTLLAAIAIGWANRRAFYVSGGSTPAGYEQGAAAWLQWRVMRCFADRGFSTYNLGGTPSSAVEENDPSHGLRRFKLGFNAGPVERRGVRWELDSPHMRGHRMKRWVNKRYQAWLR